MANNNHGNDWDNWDDDEEIDIDDIDEDGIDDSECDFGLQKEIVAPVQCQITSSIESTDASDAVKQRACNFIDNAWMITRNVPAVEVTPDGKIVLTWTKADETVSVVFDASRTSA